MQGCCLRLVQAELGFVVFSKEAELVTSSEWFTAPTKMFRRCSQMHPRSFSISRMKYKTDRENRNKRDGTSVV
jgi:hypothetical protein